MPQPSSPEAEQGVLCSILLSPKDTLATASLAGITPAHFYNPANAAIYSAMVALGNPDLISLTNAMRDSGQLEAVGGAAYLTQLQLFVATAANVDHYIEVLLDKHIRRQLMAVCREYESLAQNDDDENLLSGLSSKITALAVASERRSHRTFKDALFEKMDRVEHGEDLSNTISTGLTSLDRISRLCRGDMPLVSGERKSGKSILALTIAQNIAATGRPVLYFSLEDKEQKVIDRLVAGMCRLPIIRHNTRSMSHGDMTRFTNAVTMMAEWDFTIRDDIFDLPQICAFARNKATQTPDLGLIVVDYAQLVRATKQGSNREQEVAEVSRTFRLLAMELNTPLLLLSQLNEDGKSRESRSLENDATAMWQVKKVFTESRNPEEIQNERILAVPWQRNGESGIGTRMTFMGAIARFEDMAGEHNRGNAV